MIIPMHPPASPRRRQALTGLLLLGGGLGGFGQVVLDGKFGTSGPLPGPNYNITAGLGSTRGNNLFHSFTRFDIPQGETATFSGPANIQNILARVTGPGASSIDGTVRSEIAGANLFLINPHGVLFGANAVVDVSGAFAATTADYLKLADGARFVAALDADDSGLTTAPVSAFGFLGAPGGGITLQQSTIAVQEGKSISLVGGDVAIDQATVQAPGGEITVASVQSAGEVPANAATLDSAGFQAAFPAQGKITVANGAQLDASGDGGGRIVIRGGRLLVDQSKVQANTTGMADGRGIDVAVAQDIQLLNGGQINSISTAGLGAGGNIQLSAETLRLDGGGLVGDDFFPSTQISAATGDVFGGGGAGRGGDILIRANTVEMVNSAQITSASFGEGNAGRIEIESKAMRMDALETTVVQLSAMTQQFEGAGRSGDIVIRSDTLEMRNGATMLATSFGSGEAGRIEIDSREVNLKSASLITAGAFGAGAGGTVQVKADRLRIDGRDTLDGGEDSLTGIQAVTTAFDAPAPGGNIVIDARTVEMRNQGTLFTTSYGLGPGGNVAIEARNLKMSRGSTIRAEGLDAGPAGNISIHADNTVVLATKSAISTSALASSGGDISVTSGNEIHLFNSQVTAQAGPGGGGNITLNAPALTYALNSTVSAEAEGDGGNLSIDPIFFVLNNSSLISRSSSANGGNITILADYFLTSVSLLDPSAPFGLPGTVSVTAPNLDLSGSLIGLPGSLLDIEAQLRPDCRVRLSGDVSTFIMLGRGGLPIQPGGFLPSTVP